MRAFLGINEDGRILFGVAETIEDFEEIAMLSNMEDLKVLDVTDIVNRGEVGAIEINPTKLWGNRS